MKIKIRHKITKEIIIEGEAKDLRSFLEDNRDADLRGADLGGADLGDADLRGAYLGDADLLGADLLGAYLRGAKIKITQTEAVLKSLGLIIEK